MFFFEFSVGAGSPSTPNVDKITKDSVSLSWAKPTDDGGGKIEGYIVEKKDEKGNWVPVNKTPIKDTEFTVSDLQEGEQCQFRVRAVNEAGPGGRPVKSSFFSRQFFVTPMYWLDHSVSPTFILPYFYNSFDSH